jgi:hypothetical protein
MDLNEHEFYMLIICEKGMGKAGDYCLRITNPLIAVRDCKSRTVGIILSKNERIFKDCTPDPQRAVVKASSLKSLYEDSKEDYYKRSKIRRCKFN